MGATSGIRRRLGWTLLKRQTAFEAVLAYLFLDLVSTGDSAVSEGIFILQGDFSCGRIEEGGLSVLAEVPRLRTPFC